MAMCLCRAQHAACLAASNAVAWEAFDVSTMLVSKCVAEAILHVLMHIPLNLSELGPLVQMFGKVEVPKEAFVSAIAINTDA